MLLLARLVRMITFAVVAVIVAGILLHVLDANADNGVVAAVYDVAGWLVAPFKNVFSLNGAHEQIAANWGLAAVVYAIAGSLLASLLVRASVATDGVGFGGRGRRRREVY
jgi:hypothetical protein